MVKTINELGPSPLQKSRTAQAGQGAVAAGDDLAEFQKIGAGKKLETAPVLKK
jgi:hypothetical protein